MFWKLTGSTRVPRRPRAAVANSPRGEAELPDQSRDGHNARRLGRSRVHRLLCDQAAPQALVMLYYNRIPQCNIYQVAGAGITMSSSIAGGMGRDSPGRTCPALRTRSLPSLPTHESALFVYTTEWGTRYPGMINTETAQKRERGGGALNSTAALCPADRTNEARETDCASETYR